MLMSGPPGEFWLPWTPAPLPGLPPGLQPPSSCSRELRPQELRPPLWADICQTPGAAAAPLGMQLLKASSSSAPPVSGDPLQVELSVDEDGIARLVCLDGSLASLTPVRRNVSLASSPKAARRQVATPKPARVVSSTARQRKMTPSRVAAPSAPRPPSFTSPPLSSSSSTITYNGTDNGTLVEQIRAAVASGASRLVVDVTCNCVEANSIEVEGGEVVLRGSSDGAKVGLTLAGLRVTGGSLWVQNLAICATEENQVRAGQLQCSNCQITSRNGCGILCLQKAKVFLTDCEVVNCMRSGIGVNGKNTEIELHRCAVLKNNYSGIGVNHQARSITLSDNRIVDNGYNGVWLNSGVVAKWLGGEISGNKLSAKDGPGILQGWDDCPLRTP